MENINQKNIATDKGNSIVKKVTVQKIDLDNNVTPLQIQRVSNRQTLIEKNLVLRLKDFES